MERDNSAIALREAVRVLERRLGILDKAQAACCELTFAQCHAIVEIGRAGCISLNNLANLLDLDKSTMSRTVNNLVNNGLAIRDVYSEDRRYISIKLSEKGLSSYREIEEAMDIYFTQIYHLIPEDKREQVVDSLQVLIEAFGGAPSC
jgi:DNA-binding MarR family transcriptional regulator